MGKSALARLLAIGAIHRGRKDAARRLRPRPADLRRMGRAAHARQHRAGGRRARLQEPQETAQGRRRRRFHRRRHARPRRRSLDRDRRGFRRRLPADRRVAGRPQADAVAGAQARPSRRRGAARDGPVEGRPLRDRNSAGRSRRSRRRASSFSPNTGRSATASRATSTPAAPAARRAIRILREIAERMEEALWTRTMKAKPRG